MCRIYNKLFSITNRVDPLIHGFIIENSFRFLKEMENIFRKRELCLVFIGIWDVEKTNVK